MIQNPEPAFSPRRLTPMQLGLIVFIAILFLANAALAIGSFLNITATNKAFSGGYIVTDLSKVQRDILRLHLDTQRVLLDPDIGLEDLQLRRSLLKTQMRQAIGEITDNDRVLEEFQQLEADLEEFDRLLADLSRDPSPERREMAIPEFVALFDSLEQRIISVTNDEDSKLFEVISVALASQRNWQTYLLILSTLFLLSIVLLIHSLRAAIGQDFDRAYALVTQELTERKRIELELISAKEEAEEANRAKSDFVSLVSHELKVPMTSIQGYADLLREGAAGPVSEPQKKFLGTIRNNVYQMTRLVSDLSDISRIESGRLELDFDQISISMLFDQIVSANMAAINEKEQKLVVELPDDLPAVWGDQMRLVQIMNNLVSNAYKYTPEKGKIVIRAAQVVEAETSDKPMVQITVEDNGLGIHPDEQEQIFGKFYRANDEIARLEPGTGLGLSITHFLVEMHHGRIWFESVYRKGTKFHFTIPVYAQENND